DYLRYRGPAEPDDIHAIYQAADAFLFASSCENLPNILIEAMSSSLPIASSKAGPMPEVLKDAGLYFDPRDVADIARAMGELVADPDLRRRLAERAFRLARGYSWERCARSTFDFIAGPAAE
ncbi:unnamed protein product, partial [marine sediment metagenome]